MVSTYKIVLVRRHVTKLDPAFAATTEQLWIETSEGPHGTLEKLIVKAKRIGSEPSSHSAAHPVPHPVVCHQPANAGGVVSPEGLEPSTR